MTRKKLRIWFLYNRSMQEEASLRDIIVSSEYSRTHPAQLKKIILEVTIAQRETEKMKGRGGL